MIDPRDFGRLEGKVDSIIDRLEALERLEQRVGRNERKIHWWSGAIAGVGALLGYSVRSHIG